MAITVHAITSIFLQVTLSFPGPFIFPQFWLLFIVLLKVQVPCGWSIYQRLHHGMTSPHEPSWRLPAQDREGKTGGKQQHLLARSVLPQDGPPPGPGRADEWED